MQDNKDDRRAGVKSTTLLFGNNTKPILTGFAVIMISGIITTGMLISWTCLYTLHLVWYIGTGVEEAVSD